MKKTVCLIISVIFSIYAFAQSTQTDSIDESVKYKSQRPVIDSTLVNYFCNSFDNYNLGCIYSTDTSTFNASDHDILIRKDMIYSTLSNVGLAHKSLVFNYRNATGFDMSIPAFSAYLSTGDNIKLFMPHLPYSEIRYIMTTVDKEQHLDVTFSKQFASKFYISFDYNLDYSPGVFIKNRINNNYFWINGHYSTKDERYGVIAYYFRNKIDIQENGGLMNDASYYSGTVNEPSVLSTNLTSATNLVKVSGFGLNQYFNILPEYNNPKKSHSKASMNLNDSIHSTDSINSNDSIPYVDQLTLDSISKMDTTAAMASPAMAFEEPKKNINLGRIHYNLSYQKNQLFYNEASPLVEFYEPFDIVLDSLKTYDTTVIHSIKNSLRWSSIGYEKYNDDIPLYLFAGVEFGSYKIKGYLDYLTQEYTEDQNFAQTTLNGGIIVNLFKSTRITGTANLVTLGYQIGDFNIDGQWKQFLGSTKKNYGALLFDVNLKRQSPSWFETEYYSNHFRWNNDFSASTYMTFKLQYLYKSFNIGVKQTSINNYIYFNTLSMPEQAAGICSVREAYASLHFRVKRFEMKGLISMQQSSDENIIRLPLLLGKMKIAYSQPAFHNAAIIQPSITIQYFTEYYADAYMPALRTFYLQDDVKIGNYPFIDLGISIKVKRANIYVEYSNMYLLTGDRYSFIAPHYPMRNSKIFFGVNWRLFG